MINTYEFRPGNYLQIGGSVWAFENTSHNKAILISTMTLEVFAGPPENVFPIPIDDDWLNRFGFKLISSKNEKVWSSGKTVDEFSVFPHPDGRHFITIPTNGGAESSTIEFVHQLQNAYFDKTGSYLTAPLFSGA